VAEQAPALGKIDAGSVVQALADAKPDAIFNVLFATDLGKFVREGNTRGLFKGREVVGLLTASPNTWTARRKREGWIVTGYPWYAIKTPSTSLPEGLSGQVQGLPAPGHHRGLQRHPVDCCGPRKKANSTDTELIAAFKGLEVPRPSAPSPTAPRTTSPPWAPYGKTAYSQKMQRGVMTGQLPLRRRQGLPAHG
jgi:branched-chain amino acid transport system substrate-binding protein